MQDRDELIKDSEEIKAVVVIGSHFGIGNSKSVVSVLSGCGDYYSAIWFEVYQNSELILKTGNRIEAIDKYLSLEV